MGNIVLKIGWAIGQSTSTFKFGVVTDAEN